MLRRCIVLLLFCLFTTTVYAQSVEDDPTIIRGNEPQLANNIVITIDDCSIEENVRVIFNTLRERGITATFFPNTYYINHQDPQLWRDIVAAGFEIGYHTREHYAYLTPEELNGDFDLFVQEIRTILGDPNYNIRYVRPPRGVWNDDWMNWARSRGLLTVQWSFTSPAITRDLFEGIVWNRERGGSILLMHTSLSDLDWLHDNLDWMMSLQSPEGSTYRLTNLTSAWND
jgi:peptidoglycan/xylan/chitin deacetylase (PgdA/CDA1 family)